MPLFARTGLLIMTCLNAVPVYANAESLVYFDFEDAAGNFDNTAESTLAGISTSSWTDTQGTLTSFSGNPGKALAAKSWDQSNSFQISIAIEPGKTLSLTEISFDERASSSGAQQWELSINNVSIASGATTNGAFSSWQITPSANIYNNNLDIVLTGSQANSSSGTWRIDNFALQGEINAVPLPGALLLLLSGLSVIAINRRKHSPA